MIISSALDTCSWGLMMSALITSYFKTSTARLRAESLTPGLQ